MLNSQLKKMTSDHPALHVVMLPFLAMGHLIPFANLSNLLARRGHRVTLVSTPANLQRLPPSLSSLLHLLALPFSPPQSSPPDAECTIDVPPHQHHFIKTAFDLLEHPVAAFLKEARPDWVIYDFAAHWLPPIASRLGISFGFFCPFNAAMLGLAGPPERLLRMVSEPQGADASTATAATREVDEGNKLPRPPAWIPFETSVRMRAYELRTWQKNNTAGNETGIHDALRYALTLKRSVVVFVRSSLDFQPEWFNLISGLYKKPVVPLGFIPPELATAQKESHANDQNWVAINGWLTDQKPGSVVYVAMGTEVALSRDEVAELALGLEQSGLPFFWVLRKTPWASEDPVDMLPSGYVERIRERGMVWTSWAPQVEILGHASVGGFLSHCGWNSVIEGLSFGRVLVLLPFLNDQGVNARVLEEKKVGVEIGRDEFDGGYSRDSVAEALRIAMVDEKGKIVRENVERMKQVFGDRDRNRQYMDEFEDFLVSKCRKSV